MTTVYLIRHSEKLRNTINIDNSDSFQVSNEKIVLSSLGEEKAKRLSETNEMQDIDDVFSSNYSRAISTAKYIADVNNTDIMIMEDLGERIYGINSLDEIVSDFEIRQYDDIDYKIGYGESRRDVTTRMYNALMNIITEHNNKRIAIVSHGTAMCFLLTKWCDISLKKEDKYIVSIKYNDKVIFDREFRTPEVFKLTFGDDFNLIDIENIEYEKNIH